MTNETEDVIDVRTDLSNNLVINFSKYLGYECIVEVTPWTAGISWTGIEEDGDTLESLNELGLPLSGISSTEGAASWINTFPAEIKNQLLDYEIKYRGTTYALLWFISRSKYALELFQSNPLLTWFVLKTAQAQRWNINYTLELFSNKRTKILAACGLEESKAVLKMIQKFDAKQFKQFEFEIIKNYNWKIASQNLSHLPFIDRRLLTFLHENPEFVTSKLIQKFNRDWYWSDFEITYKDILNLAEGLEIVDINSRIRSCKSLQQLINLHDKLVYDYNEKKLKNIPLIEYAPPPIAGTQTIVPITNNHELNREAKRQRHCIASYDKSIQKEKYYAYQVLQPERATLGLRLIQAGIYKIDQIYLKYNHPVSDETKEAVMEWFNRSVGEYKNLGS